MAIVSSCVYDARGRLARPGELELSRARMRADFDTGEALTLDRGRVHVQAVTARGTTPAQARQRAGEKLARFFAIVEPVLGYRKVSMTRTQGELAASGNHSVSYEIVYAIEPPGLGARSPQSRAPDAGLLQDRSAAVR